MTSSNFSPTPYPEVNQVLERLLTGIQQILGESLTGLYLHGSLAGGDFNPRRSDIDFLAVTKGALSGEVLDRLAAMHRDIRASGLAWAAHMEGSYLPAAALRRYDSGNDRHPALDVDGNFKVEEHGNAWIIQRHILREKGIALVGPPLRPLIDPVSPNELRRAQIGTLREWWKPQLDAPDLLRSREYQAYGVLTMCRALYTLRFGEIVSKAAAAAWAMKTLDPEWTSIIESALAWPDGMQPDSLPETLELIAYTLNEAENYSPDTVVTKE